MSWVVGALGAIGAVIAGVFGLGKLLSGGLDHQFRTCPCAGCQRRRNQAWQRQRGSMLPARVDPPDPRHVREHWYSTVELRSGHIVVLNRRIYDVVGKRTEMRGYFVELKNRHTRQQFITTVPLDLGPCRMWEPR